MTLNSVESWLTDGCKAEDFAHIEDATKEELSGKVAEASKWLDERQTMSANAPKTQDPPFFAREVSDKAREINGAYIAVKSIPKPEPKKKENKLKATVKTRKNLKMFKWKTQVKKKQEKKTSKWKTLQAETALAKKNGPISECSPTSNEDE